MENASKALLIAGAILIAIVLISLGVMILGQGSESIKNNDMSEADIAGYNQPFEQFIGNNKRGNVVRQLVDKVNQHNRANADDPSKLITMDGNSDGTLQKSSYGAGYAYDVTAGYDNGGLINTITTAQK